MEGLATVVKKKRSSISRRPWPNPQSTLHDCFQSFNEEDELSQKSERVNKDLKTFRFCDGGNGKQMSSDTDLKHCIEGVLALSAPTNEDSIPHVPVTCPKKENKPIKVKLKFSGAILASVPTDSLCSSEQPKLRSQDNSDYSGSSREKSSVIQRDSLGKVKIRGEAIIKGKKLPTRGVLDAAFEDSDEDDEIRFLKKLGASKFDSEYAPHYQNEKDEYSTKSWRNTSGSKGNNAYHLDNNYGVSSGWTTKSRSKTSFEGEFIDTDYVSRSKRKKLMKESDNILTKGGLQPLTTRQRAALQTGNDGGVSSLIEFPDGLPPAPSRNKVKLSEEEKLAKKAEIAQRRKMQAEKADRESKEKTIRKILGLDTEKKKAEKERAQADKAKAANSETLLSNMVRLVMGPNGTIVTFPKGVALPSIFDSKPCSYPPPREKCAGPSCTNSYKYRDSRSNLPLCSLLCYKAVQGSVNSVTTW